MRIRALFVLAAVLICSNAYAQQNVYVFPQFADGISSDGTSYRSTVALQPVNTFSSTPVSCTLRLFGLTTTFDNQSAGDVFSLSIGANEWLQLKTLGIQPLAAGYATMTCSAAVYAHVTFAYYTSDGKMGEATVYAVPPTNRFRLVADQSEGARLGLAIANDTDADMSFDTTLRRADGSTYARGTIIVGARQRLSRFLDEILPSTAGKIVEVDMHATDFSNFAVIGLRFTGGVFNTIPAN
jgi:hypothetical protein